MTVIKQLDCPVRDSSGSLIPNKFVSISIKVSETSPKYLIHKSIVIQDTNKRQGTASSKTRSEVQGGGKKPWKQKGTGRARSGSSNSPLWNGGGVTFGPKPRTYQKKMNIKEKSLALTTAFYSNSRKIIVIKNLFDNIHKPKTKEILTSIAQIVEPNENKKILIVMDSVNENIRLSLRNIPYIQLSHSKNTNVRDILLANYILITEDSLLNITKSTNE
jgi:large subunit ribosomal protein L4